MLKMRRTWTQMLKHILQYELKATLSAHSGGGACVVGIFSGGGTVLQHIPYMRNACVFLRYNPGRKTKAASHSAKGLARGSGRIGPPKPAVPKSVFVKTLNSVSSADEFIQAI